MGSSPSESTMNNNSCNLLVGVVVLVIGLAVGFYFGSEWHKKQQEQQMPLKIQIPGFNFDRK